MKNVTSEDPRKAAIVEALKDIYKASKVTLLRENADGSFTGRCLRYADGAFIVIGDRTVKHIFVDGVYYGVDTAGDGK